MSRTAGSLLLIRLGKTQAEIGRACGVSHVAVNGWKNGTKRPGKAMREKLFELYKIPVESWDELAKAGLRSVPKKPPGDDDASVLGGPIGLAKELEDQARELLESLRNPDDDALVTSPLEQARCMASIATTLEKLTKITGQHDIGRRMLQTPMFKETLAAILAALEPHPGAAKAVAEAMDLLEKKALKTGYNRT